MSDRRKRPVLTRERVLTGLRNMPAGASLSLLATRLTANVTEVREILVDAKNEGLVVDVSPPGGSLWRIASDAPPVEAAPVVEANPPAKMPTGGKNKGGKPSSSALLLAELEQGPRPLSVLEGIHSAPRSVLAHHIQSGRVVSEIIDGIRWLRLSTDEPSVAQPAAAPAPEPTGPARAPMVYVAAPLRGESAVEERWHLDRARLVAKLLLRDDLVPIVPHDAVRPLVSSGGVDEGEERTRGLSRSCALLREVLVAGGRLMVLQKPEIKNDVVLNVGDQLTPDILARVSEGCAAELQVWARHGLRPATLGSWSTVVLLASGSPLFDEAVKLGRLHDLSYHGSEAWFYEQLTSFLGGGPMSSLPAAMESIEQFFIRLKAADPAPAMKSARADFFVQLGAVLGIDAPATWEEALEGVRLHRAELLRDLRAARELASMTLPTVLPVDEAGLAAEEARLHAENDRVSEHLHAVLRVLRCVQALRDALGEREAA